MSAALTREEAVSLYEDAPCGYVFLSLAGTVLRCNNTLARWVGLSSSEDMEGQPFEAFLTAASRLLYGTYYSSLLQLHGVVSDIALELRQDTSQPLAVMITSRLKAAGESQPSYISATLFDMTERRRYERELVIAKRKADTLADVVRFSDTAILTASFDLELETWNAAAQRLLETSLAAVGSLYNLLPESCIHQCKRSIELASPVVVEQQIAPGTIWRITSYPLSDGVAVFLLDVTQERAAQTALQQAHERFALATMATSDGIWDLDWQTDALFTSGHVQAMLGMEAKDLHQNLASWLRRVHPEDVHKLRFSQVVPVQESGQRFEAEYRIMHEDRSWRWFHSRGMPLLSRDGSLLRVIGAVTDITLRKKEDSLTLLHTRLSLLEHLDRYFTGELDKDYGVALFFVDIDSFKKVNDGFSHAVGDQVLVEVSRRLRSFLGTHKDSIAARARADEFLVLLHSVQDSAQAWSIARELHVSLERPFFAGEQLVRISTSVGIALAGEATTSAERMLRDADLAMHRAKAEGTGNTVLFSHAMRLELADRLQLEADLHRALDEDNLSLLYQPKVDLRTREIVGFEALGRWHHPTRGMVPPDTFIGIAEESELICDIGRWTLSVALRQLAEWRQRAAVPLTTTISVNLSPKQFGDPGLVIFLRTELARNRLPATCLTLEVTEGILIGNTEQASRILTELKNVGVGLELDDFGKGYSSLSYLSRYPFDALKIDRAFVSKLGSEDDSSAITRSIVALGHALNLRVIAEGIETLDQLHLLVAMGCSYGQGYLFAKPSSNTELQQVLGLDFARIAL